MMMNSNCLTNSKNSKIQKMTMMKMNSKILNLMTNYCWTKILTNSMNSNCLNYYSMRTNWKTSLMSCYYSTMRSLNWTMMN